MFSAKTDLGDRGRVQNDLVRDIDPTGEEASRGEHVLAETDGAGRRDHVGVNDGAGADVHCGGSVPRATSCLLYTSPSPRDVEESRMPSSA